MIGIEVVHLFSEGGSRQKIKTSSNQIYIQRKHHCFSRNKRKHWENNEVKKNKSGEKKLLWSAKSSYMPLRRFAGKLIGVF